MADGDEKENQITKKMELEVRIRKLTKNDNKAGAISVLEAEYDADLLERQIAGMNSFVTAVTDRKTQLP